jgi:hypothetical protein
MPVVGRVPCPGDTLVGARIYLSGLDEWPALWSRLLIGARRAKNHRVRNGGNSNGRSISRRDGQWRRRHTYLSHYTRGFSKRCRRAAYEAKALEAAAHGCWCPTRNGGGMTAKIHIDRGGQLAPYGDDLASGSETKTYFLWEQDGSPDGRADEYWHRALDQHLRERAYVLWEQAGRPEGEADVYWRSIREFEAQ